MFVLIAFATLPAMLLEGGGGHVVELDYHKILSEEYFFLRMSYCFQ